MKPVRIMCLNVNGGLTVKLGCDEMIDVVDNFDVLFFSETWTKDSDERSLNGFAKPFVKNRKKKLKARRGSGALVCYFRDWVTKGIKEEYWFVF